MSFDREVGLSESGSCLSLDLPSHLQQEGYDASDVKKSLESRTAEIARSCCVLVVGGHSRGECRKPFNVESLESALSPKFASYSSLPEGGGARILADRVDALSRSSTPFADQEVISSTARARTSSCSSLKGVQPPSPFELVVVARRAADEESQDFIRFMTHIVQEDSEFHPRLAVRFLDENEGSLLYINPSGEARLAPQREIDSAFVCGDPEVMEEYKEKTYDGISSLSSDKLRQWKKNFLKQELRDLKNILNPEPSLKRKSGAIDLESGELHYDNIVHSSVKYPYLRVVQHWIVFAIMIGVKNGVITKEDFFEMPHGTSDRIDWLTRKGFWNLDEEQVNHLKEGYEAALSYYFESQTAYEENGRTVIHVDSRALRSLGEKIYSITNELPPVRELLIDRKAIKEERKARWGIKK